MFILVAIEKTKKWLERNSIFFTVGASILLSVMAIIVSIQTNKLVSHQNKLISLEYIPEFSINSKYYYDPNDINQAVVSEELNIFNNGGYYYDTLDSRIINFLNLKITNNGKVKEIKLPVLYYFFTTMSNNKVGFIGRIWGDGDNYKKFFELYKFILNFEKTNKDIFCEIELETYAKLSYNDKLNGVKKTDYYIINYGEGVLMVREDGEKIYKLFDGGIEHLNISDLEKIKDEIGRQIENNL